MAAPIVLLNAVGLTRRLLPSAPRLASLASSGWCKSLVEAIPAVTCTAQATILTGKEPRDHGVVANGWYFRDTGEVRFWQQSNRLIQAEPLYETVRRRARERGGTFRTAKLFWWFNQGAAVDLSVTPKPYYGADGNKAFGIAGTPDGLTDRLEKHLGPFPFRTFWGPGAGLPCTEWIARCAAEVLGSETPDLTLAYLPHLDYDPQRFGPTRLGPDMDRLVGELDSACVPILDAASKVGAEVWVVSEYGHCDVTGPVYLNRELRRAGMLSIRPGPFGEVFDPMGSRAFAVCDHQVAHVYVHERDEIERTAELLRNLSGVARVLVGEERAGIGLDHPRSGEIVTLSSPDAWFAYPFWIDDRAAPDYARTVDIHRKPGYDPCELFLDPNLMWPQGRVLRRLLEKKLGLRTLFDVMPLDAEIVRGSHGLRAGEEVDRPILIGAGADPVQGDLMPMTSVRDSILKALDLED